MEIKVIRRKRNEEDSCLLRVLCSKYSVVEFTKGQRTAEKRDTQRYNLKKCPLFKGKEEEPKKKKNLLEVGGEPGWCVFVEAGRGASRSRNKSIVKVYTRSQGNTDIIRQGLWVGGDL